MRHPPESTSSLTVKGKWNPGLSRRRQAGRRQAGGRPSLQFPGCTAGCVPQLVAVMILVVVLAAGPGSEAWNPAR